MRKNDNYMKKIYYTIKPILDILQQQNELTKSLCSWAILAFFKNRLTYWNPRELAAETPF